MSRVQGFDRLIDRLNELGKADFVKLEIAEAGRAIEDYAKQNASEVIAALTEKVKEKVPNLSQEIKHTISESGLAAKINQNLLPLGAYIEFGTGIHVEVAPEWEGIARKFYVNGKGTLPATPYLYPAFVKGRKEFIKNLRAHLRQLTR